MAKGRRPARPRFWSKVLPSGSFVYCLAPGPLSSSARTYVLMMQRGDRDQMLCTLGSDAVPVWRDGASSLPGMMDALAELQDKIFVNEVMSA